MYIIFVCSFVVVLRQGLLPLSLGWPEFGIPHVSISQVLKLQARVTTPGSIHFILKFTFTMCTLTIATLGDVGRWGREQMWFGLRSGSTLERTAEEKPQLADLAVTVITDGSLSSEHIPLYYICQGCSSKPTCPDELQKSCGNKNKASFVVRLLVHPASKSHNSI